MLFQYKNLFENLISKLILLNKSQNLLKVIKRNDLYNNCQYSCCQILFNANKNPKRSIDKNTINNHKWNEEEVRRRSQIIDVWDGMSPSELAKAMRLPLDNIHEVMTKNNIQVLESVSQISEVLKFYHFRANSIKKPSIEEKIQTFDFNHKIDSIVRKGSLQSIRPPVVTIMGHVDHGKTTLLDSLRHSEIAKQEEGGITQHIGAFVVSLNDNKKSSKITDLVTFLDTPGHAAFSAMRERGSLITDIVVLVVAADDGVMEQTIESISFANASNVPIIVAINKIDKITDKKKDLEHLKRGLIAQGIVLEEEGGDVQAIQMSALKGIGLNELKEAILALAETLELKAYVDGSVEAVVLESSVDPHRGKLASILVQSGTLKKGDILIAGEHSWAKVRSMFDEWGNVVQKCSPGYPVQVIGWRDDTLPDAGDKVWQFDNERQIKEVLNAVKARDKQTKAEMDAKAANIKLEEHLKVYKPELAARRAAGIRYKRKRATAAREKLISNEGDEYKLNVIVKSDVNGSLEVLLNIFDSYPNDKSVAKLNLLHYGIGSITENDVELAACFDNSIIYSFNIGPLNNEVIKLAKDLNVRLKRFNVIYHLVDDLKNEISEKLPLIDEEVVLGEAVVIQEFIVNERHKKIPVAGARCSKGVLKKSNCLYKVVRRDEVLSSGLKIAAMRHLKDEVDTIKKDIECGLRFQDIVGLEGLRFQPQDLIVCYEIKKTKQKTKWSPPKF